LFDANPLLWDLCELVSNAGFLSHCLVLIRALMTVQRTHWASTSLTKENIFDTQRYYILFVIQSVKKLFQYKQIVEIVVKKWYFASGSLQIRSRSVGTTPTFRSVVYFE
jgi:hypothetical protein